jgi:hypothetical protein
MVLEEVRQTKKIKYNIENDLAGKEVAMDIDHQVRLIFYVLAANFLAYLITKEHIWQLRLRIVYYILKNYVVDKT